MAVIGAGTGVVGALTGIAGAVVSWRSYKLARRVKKSDLKADLSKLKPNISHSFSEVGKLMDEALRSRRAIASATGMFRSSTIERFSRRVDKAKESLWKLEDRYNSAIIGAIEVDERSLEAALSEAHFIRRRLESLREEFQSNLQQDRERSRDLANRPRK